MIQYMNIFILYIILVISYNTSYAYAPTLHKKITTQIYIMCRMIQRLISCQNGIQGMDPNKVLVSKQRGEWE